MTILELLDQYGIEYKQAGEHRHVTQGFIGIDCPSCSPNSGKFKMGYSLSHNYLTCWSCGYLPIPQTLQELTGEPFHKIRELLGDVQAFLPQQDFKRTPGKLVMPNGVGQLENPHRRYLKDRGFLPKHIWDFWDVKGIGLASRLPWRLFIPIYHQGRMVSWTTRALKDEGVIRYISASPEEEELPHRSLLYGEDHCRHAIIVCEGPLDVWRIGPGAAATFGTMFSKAQVAKISRFPLKGVWFDAEPAAQRQAAKLIAELAPYPGCIWNIVSETGKDASRSSEEEVKKVRSMFSLEGNSHNA